MIHFLSFVLYMIFLLPLRTQSPIFSPLERWCHRCVFANVFSSSRRSRSVPFISLWLSPTRLWALRFWDAQRFWELEVTWVIFGQRTCRQLALNSQIQVGRRRAMEPKQIHRCIPPSAACNGLKSPTPAVLVSRFDSRLIPTDVGLDWTFALTSPADSSRSRMLSWYSRFVTQYYIDDIFNSENVMCTIE